MTHQEGKKAPALFDAHCHLDWEADPDDGRGSNGQRAPTVGGGRRRPSMTCRDRRWRLPQRRRWSWRGRPEGPWWWRTAACAASSDVDLAAELATRRAAEYARSRPGVGADGAPLTVGEVGLDFSPADAFADAALGRMAPRSQPQRRAEVRALTRICELGPPPWAPGRPRAGRSQTGPSLHAVPSPVWSCSGLAPPAPSARESTKGKRDFSRAVLRSNKMSGRGAQKNTTRQRRKSCVMHWFSGSSANELR